MILLTNDYNYLVAALSNVAAVWGLVTEVCVCSLCFCRFCCSVTFYLLKIKPYSIIMMHTITIQILYRNYNKT